MPLLSICARFHNSNVCKVQLGAGNIPACRMRLKMYAVHLKEVDVGSDIPTYCMVSLDGILGNTQIHNALPKITKTVGPAQEDTDTFQQNSHLTLPLTGLVTVQQCQIGVEVNKHIPRQLTIKAMRYDVNNKVVDFEHTAAGAVVGVDHVQLWFEYARPGLL